MAESKAYASHDEEMIPLQVYVTAPATLAAGYTFEALVNDDPDRPFTCEVVRRKGFFLFANTFFSVGTAC